MIASILYWNLYCTFWTSSSRKFEQPWALDGNGIPFLILGILCKFFYFILPILYADQYRYANSLSRLGSDVMGSWKRIQWRCGDTRAICSPWPLAIWLHEAEADPKSRKLNVCITCDWIFKHCICPHKSMLIVTVVPKLVMMHISYCLLLHNHSLPKFLACVSRWCCLKRVQQSAHGICLLQHSVPFVVLSNCLRTSLKRWSTSNRLCRACIEWSWSV